jgi:cytochrome c6
MSRIATVVALVLLGAGAVRADDGATLFKQRCASCHGPDGKGKTKMGEKMGVKDLTAIKASEAEIQKTIADGKPGTKMLGYKGKISDADIKALATYVKGGIK